MDFIDLQYDIQNFLKEVDKNITEKYTKIKETRKKRIMKVLRMKKWGVINLTGISKQKRTQVRKALHDMDICDYMILRYSVGG